MAPGFQTWLGGDVPSHLVDLSARSRVFRAQRLLSHAWVASPSEVIAFLRDPRAELKKLGIRLPSNCRIETLMQNHDWLAGHTDGMEREGRVSVFFRGEGDGETFYRVSLFANKTTVEPLPRELLHSPDEEEKPRRRITKRARDRVDATRRSMMASPLHLAAHRWIAPLLVVGPTTKSSDEAHRIFAGITAAVARVVEHNADVRAARDGVAALLQRSFHPAYTLLFRIQRTPAATLHGAFAGAMYAKSLWVLRTSGWHFDAIVNDVEQLLKDVAPTLRTLADALETIDADLVAHTVVEATLLRRENALLDAHLSEAEQLFDRYNGAHPERSARFHAPGRALEAFASSNANEWWFLPGLVAFALAVWPDGTAGSAR
jgi:hypothetical protein